MGSNPTRSSTKYPMRNFIDLVEQASERPEFFYHGTNIVAAASILKDNTIEAFEQDEHHEGNHHSVSLTTDADKGRDFAIEYVRTNSALAVGAVFKLDADLILDRYHCVPFEAQTAGEFEYEYRLWDNIWPLKNFLIDFEVVGDRSSLMDEDDPEELDRPTMLELFDVYGRHHFYTVDEMEDAIRNVLQKG